ncbi:MAG TPA: hypothetical protein VMP86_08020 [Candidatus Binatia bacterium]|nr:hypothetical protein [Candidatus Binatia bacterium]
MVIAALVTFAALLAAWILAPDRSGQPQLTDDAAAPQAAARIALAALDR